MQQAQRGHASLISHIGRGGGGVRLFMRLSERRIISNTS